MTSAHKIKSLPTDIRFWIILFFALRLFAITDPPLETAHNWRQTTVTMAARNFLEEDPNIFYPRVDFAGNKTGITGMEFPLLNYLIYIVSLVFGYAHWYGRLINLAVSSLGIWFFYKLLCRCFSKQTAFYSALLLLLSVWFTYSRKIMPDTFSMSLLITGFYYGHIYLKETGNSKTLAAYLLLTLAGALSKLPSAYTLVLFLPYLVDKSILPRRKTLFLCASGLVFMACCWYYFTWVSGLNEKFGFTHFFMGKSINEGTMDIRLNFNQALQKFYEEALGFSGFLIMLAGLLLAIKTRQKKIVAVFLLAFMAFMVVILKAGFGFFHHAYYIIPFAPIMALCGGYALSLIANNNLRVALLALFFSEAIATKFVDFHVNPEYMAITKLEEKLNHLGNKNDKILINSGTVPTPMYFAHRKGWIEGNAALLRDGYIDSLKPKGLKHIIILKQVFGQDISLDYKLIYNDEDFKIYSLEDKL